ncbi:hypothetical protein ACP70R_005816 [Stipagrostis hirtigluma subsp. patula]
MMLVAVAIIAAALVVVLQLSWPSAAAAPAIGHWCGDVEVPYPFGITPNCSYPAPGFNLTCDHTAHPPRLLLGDGTARVAGIFPENSTMLVYRTGAVNASIGSGGVRHDKWWSGVLANDGSFFLAAGSNELVVKGPNAMGTLRDRQGRIYSGCASFGFTDEAPIGAGKYCTGIGCCQAQIAWAGTSLDLRVDLVGLDHTLYGTLAFIAKGDWYNETIDARLSEDESTSPWYTYRDTVEVPVVLAWVIWPSGTEAERVIKSAQNYSPPIYPPTTYLLQPGMGSESECISPVNRICQSGNSVCWDTLRGYNCVCRHGYQGNAYLLDGCQDINECDNKHAYNCFGKCTNTIGSFRCRCPLGTRGNHSRPGGCVRPHTGMVIGVSVASGPAFLLLVIGLILIHRTIKHHIARRLKQKFFKQNRGQLLQQLISHRADIAERMIVPVEELEKATNNFDQSRKLGGGGHGTVYKGILSDLQVVAIKKPNNAIQREIKEFINEVAILSQINHRNVVKLLGCCLEAQVPLLVYEFISNGTLKDHLHKDSTVGSLSWRDRLRIATEAAKAIAYLHSSVSIPIVHRDIKSANILLDDALTAKVSDFGASRYIPIDQTCDTTAVQGTPGYLDPMYCRTGLLTEMSDVYSFGVMLVELLTRKIPSSYRTPNGDGLVGEFKSLLAEGNLVQILDPQVVDEGDKEVEEVAALAVSCTKYNGEERPTMRQVEMTLEAFHAPKQHVLDDVLVEETDGNNASSSHLQTRRRNIVEVSRQYSLEEEFMISARYPR